MSKIVGFSSIQPSISQNEVFSDFLSEEREPFLYENSHGSAIYRSLNHDFVAKPNLKFTENTESEMS